MSGLRLRGEFLHARKKGERAVDREFRFHALAGDRLDHRQRARDAIEGTRGVPGQVMQAQLRRVVPAGFLVQVGAADRGEVPLLVVLVVGQRHEIAGAPRERLGDLQLEDAVEGRVQHPASVAGVVAPRALHDFRQRPPAVRQVDHVRRIVEAGIHQVAAGESRIRGLRRHLEALLDRVQPVIVEVVVDERDGREEPLAVPGIEVERELAELECGERVRGHGAIDDREHRVRQRCFGAVAVLQRQRHATQRDQREQLALAADMHRRLDAQQHADRHADAFVGQPRHLHQRARLASRQQGLDALELRAEQRHDVGARPRQRHPEQAHRLQPELHRRAGEAHVEAAHGALVEIAHGARDDARARPVVGQQREQFRTLVVVGALVPLRRGLVQGATLREQHQVVGHLVRDDMVEAIRQLGLGLEQHRERGRAQGLEQRFEGPQVGLHRMDLAQQPHHEGRADDAGDLEDELLARRQPVDARGHEAAHGVWKGQRLDVDVAREAPASLVDHDHAGLVQRRREFLGQERMARGAAADQGLDVGAQLGRSQSTAGERQRLFVIERPEREHAAMGGVAKLVEFRRLGIDARARRHGQQQPLDLAAGVPGQRPGQRVEPVRVFQDHAGRTLRRAALQAFDQQVVRGARTHRPGDVRGLRRLAATEREQRAQQRRARCERLAEPAFDGAAAQCRIIDAIDAEH